MVIFTYPFRVSQKSYVSLSMVIRYCCLPELMQRVLIVPLLLLVGVTGVKLMNRPGDFHILLKVT